MKQLFFLVLLMMTLVSCSRDEAVPEFDPTDTNVPATNTPKPTADHTATAEAQQEIALQEMEDAFLPVCESGVGANAAAPYQQASGIHPAYSILVMPTDDEFSESTINILDKIVSHLQEGSYASTSIEETELVICIEPVKHQIVEMCKYNDGTTSLRVQRQMRLTIVEARTGQQVFTTIVEGREPKSCPYTKSASATGSIIIGEVRSRDVDKAVETYTDLP